MHCVALSEDQVGRRTAKMDNKHFEEAQTTQMCCLHTPLERTGSCSGGDSPIIGGSDGCGETSHSCCASEDPMK